MSVTHPAPAQRALLQVPSGDVTLATRDLGGNGTPLVLTHGAGRRQEDLDSVAALLVNTFHVVTYDMRGHGRSTGDSWTMATALQDLDAVIAAHGLANPAVGGHSLGGIVALTYGAAHPDCPGVINIDGWGHGREDLFDGADPKAVAEYLSRARLGELSPLLKAITALGGRRKQQVNRSMLGELANLDVVALHEQVKCPALSFNATAPIDGLLRVLLGRQAALHNAMRTGLSRTLRALTTSQPNVSVTEITAGHGLIRTHPRAVADAILAALA